MSKSRHTEAQMIGALKQVGGGEQGGRRSQRSGSIETHDLRLEGEVRWHGCEPGPGSEAVA